MTKYLILLLAVSALSFFGCGGGGTVSSSDVSAGCSRGGVNQITGYWASLSGDVEACLTQTENDFTGVMIFDGDNCIPSGAATVSGTISDVSVKTSYMKKATVQSFTMHMPDGASASISEAGGEYFWLGANGETLSIHYVFNGGPCDGRESFFTVWRL